MSKFTAAELVEFYKKVAAGGVMELNTKGNWYVQGYSSPNISSMTDQWRIKPAKKIIDMAHFIKSGIDCEFSDNDISHWFINKLIEIGDPLKPYQCSIDEQWDKCRPRMNHQMYHDGGECPLPNGFGVKVYHRNGDSSYFDTATGQKEWVHRVHSQDIIGYEIFGLTDGYKYAWERLKRREP